MRRVALFRDLHIESCLAFQQWPEVENDPRTSYKLIRQRRPDNKSLTKRTDNGDLTIGA
jgi:hypothetical protein